VAEEHQEEDVPDVSEWVSSTKKATCPACGAAGALPLGGGIFCPTCGEVSTNPGYTPPGED
jgi:ribosomal protein L37AE/L43A